VRLRLTLLYGGLVLASGTGLLVITYLLVAHSLPAAVTRHAKGSALAGAAVSARAGTSSGSATSARTPTSADTGTSAGARVPAGEAISAGPVLSVGPGAAVPACAAARSLPVASAAAARCARQLQAYIAGQRAAEMDQLLTQSGIALAITSVISVGLGWLVAGRVLRPLRTITAAARRVSASSLDQRLALDGPDDELKELGDTFDALLSRLGAAFGAQRQFVANASHELRTPLARQRTVLEVALADPQATVDSLGAACRRVLAAGDQQERLIEALLTLARSQRGLDRREPVELSTVAGATLRSRLAEARHRGLAVSAELRAGPVLGDARLAERLVANLLDNALRHNTPGGWIRVTTGTWAGHAVLTVANTGPVIAPAEAGRLFEPFTRLGADRTSRDGLGLGLSIVRAIADAHHARLRARSRRAGGLEIQVRFPLGVAARAETGRVLGPGQPERPPPAAGGRAIVSAAVPAG
jgi:signal transduction histidine kinase